jgi:hypothetical protein
MFHMFCKRFRLKMPLLALMILPLSACATQEGDFPSLSKRPYESAEPIAAPDPTPAAITTSLPAALAEQTNRLLERNRIAHSAFVRARGAAESAARSGSGAPNGSENWVQAQMVLSRLDASRADSVSALGEIDRLVTGERNKGADPGLIGLLDQVQSEIASTVAEQEAVISRLYSTIGR